MNGNFFKKLPERIVGPDTVICEGGDGMRISVQYSDLKKGTPRAGYYLYFLHNAMIAASTGSSSSVSSVSASPLSQAFATFGSMGRRASTGR